MSDIQSLDREISAAIAQAADEAALEQVRVSALGKKGSISELLKTQGIAVSEVQLESGRLDEVFRTITQGTAKEAA